MCRPLVADKISGFFFGFFCLSCCLLCMFQNSVIVLKDMSTFDLWLWLTNNNAQWMYPILQLALCWWQCVVCCLYATVSFLEFIWIHHEYCAWNWVTIIATATATAAATAAATTVAPLRVLITWRQLNTQPATFISISFIITIRIRLGNQEIWKMNFVENITHWVGMYFKKS